MLLVVCASAIKPRIKAINIKVLILEVIIRYIIYAIAGCFNILHTIFVLERLFRILQSDFDTRLDKLNPK